MPSCVVYVLYFTSVLHSWGPGDTPQEDGPHSSTGTFVHLGGAAARGGKLSFSPLDVTPFLSYLYPFAKSPPLPASVFSHFFLLSELTKGLPLWFLILDMVLASVFCQTYNFLDHCCSL